MAKKNYAIVAAFPDSRRARRAADELASRGLPRHQLRLVGRDERDWTRNAEMRTEATEGIAGPGVGLMTPARAKGAAIGIATGALIGLLIGLAIGGLWGWLTDSAIGPVGRMIIAAACFAVGGAVVGAVDGGALNTHRERLRQHAATALEGRPSSEADTLLEVRVKDERDASMVHDTLKSAGAERIDADWKNGDG